MGDISSEAVNRARSLHCSERPGLRIEVADATALPLDFCPDEGFALVVDKCGADSLHFRTRTKDSRRLLEKLFREVHRVLIPGGCYVWITPKAHLRYIRGAAPW